VIGAHFANINNKITENNRPQFNSLINKEIKLFADQVEYERLNNVTICTFNSQNTADDPKLTLEDYKNYFTNTFDLTKRKGKLNNKKSAGLDNIPNIILKKYHQN